MGLIGKVVTLFAAFYALRVVFYLGAALLGSGGTAGGVG
jgi:hypothetical protein